MTAIPVNKPGSAEVHFTDLVINGDTDGVGGDLLILLGRQRGFRAVDRRGADAEFHPRDLGELRDKIKRAVNQRREKGAPL